MQLEELNQQWKQLDMKLDRSIALNNELLRQVVLQPARRRIHRLAFWPALDVAFCLGLLALGFLFLNGHAYDWKLIAPTAVVMLCALALLINSMFQLQRIAQLDWSGPVVDIQTELQQLHVMKVQQFKWIILLSPLVWICSFMIGLHWVFGWLTVDRVKVLDELHPWVVANYVFGILFVPLGYLLARTLADRFKTRSWWQTLLKGISGNSLQSARHDLQHWERLRQESGA